MVRTETGFRYPNEVGDPSSQMQAFLRVQEKLPKIATEADASVVKLIKFFAGMENLPGSRIGFNLETIGIKRERLAVSSPPSLNHRKVNDYVVCVGEVNNDPYLTVITDSNKRLKRLFPNGLSEEEKSVLRDRVGEIIGCVGLVETRLKLSGSQANDLSFWLGRDLIIPPKNPTQNELSKMPEGLGVMLSGEIKGFEVIETQYVGGKERSLRCLSVECPDQYLTVYSSPGYSPIYANDPERSREISVGDTVTFMARVRTYADGNGLYLKDNNLCLVENVSANWEQRITRG